jgi:hypothetical protein
MVVLVLNYRPCFFTTNTMGCQPTASQYYQPLALQTSALGAAVIHGALSEYSSGKEQHNDDF